MSFSYAYTKDLKPFHIITIEPFYKPQISFENVRFKICREGCFEIMGFIERLNTIAFVFLRDDIGS